MAKAGHRAVKTMSGSSKCITRLDLRVRDDVRRRIMAGGRDGDVMERFDDVIGFGCLFLAQSQSLVVPADIEEGKYRERTQ